MGMTNLEVMRGELQPVAAGNEKSKHMTTTTYIRSTYDMAVRRYFMSMSMSQLHPLRLELQIC
jgi:hypothetical protein